MPRKVLLLTARVGSGHVQAAQAIAESLAAAAHSGGDTARPPPQVTTLDVMQLVPAWFRRLYAGGYAALVTHAPALFGVLYERFDACGGYRPARAPDAAAADDRGAAGDARVAECDDVASAVARLPRSARLRLAFESRMLRRLWTHLAADPPDWIVHTHFLAPGPTATWLARYAPHARQVVVVTDMYPHRIWLAPRVECYFVATDAARPTLIDDGIAPGRICVSGIPIRAKHRLPIHADDARRSLGWPADRPVLAVLAGSDFVVGPIEQVVAVLVRAFPAALVHAFVGHNARLHRALAERFAAARNFRVTGYTEQMPEILTAATLVLTKPGGLTATEALVHGAGLICLFPIPGQEAANADSLLENGAALKVTHLRELLPAVRRALEQPGLLDGLRGHARRLARPDAADRIAAFVLRRD